MPRIQPVGLDRVIAWAKAAQDLADPDVDGYAGRTDAFPENTRRAHCKACGSEIAPGAGVPWIRFYRGGWAITAIFLCASCDRAVVEAVPRARRLFK